MGRTTFQELLGNPKEIDYTGISDEKIEKKYISEYHKKTKYYYICLDKNGKVAWPSG